MAHILLVEDEIAVANLVQKSLAEAGYSVSWAAAGQEAQSLLAQHPFDLLILDIMLPGLSGLELCRQWRAKGFDLPILMLTALGTTENIVQGLDGGADDYLIKPFKLAELQARIRALLRRGAGPDPVQGLRFADLELDLQAKTVTRQGVRITLTATEFRLLAYLMRHPRRVLSRLDILEAVWDVDFDMGTNVVDVYVNYLRKKVDKPFGAKLIHTVIGMGYVLKETND